MNKQVYLQNFINKNSLLKQFSTIGEVDNELIIIVEYDFDNFFQIIRLLKDECDQFKEIILIKVLGEIDCTDVTFDDNLDLSYCVFQNNLNFDRCNFMQYVNFSNCTFNGNFNFYECHFEMNADFKDSTFNGDVNFDQTFFENKTRFHYSEFHNCASFENTKFNALVDFFKAEFFKSQRFHLTDFNDIAIFSNVTFNGPVQFLYNKINTKTFISFENANFKQSLDLSRANFWCRLQVWSIEIKMPIDLSFYYPKEKYFEEFEKKLIALKSIRESYRRIKQEFRNDHNNIEAIRFQEYEMTVYKNELKIRSNKIKNKCQDKITLWFNKWSNKFGTRWDRGIAFTVIATIIFYSFFLILISDSLCFDFSNEGFGNLFKYFFQFLNIASWTYEPFGINYTWAYIALFIGRIFIGYGYYQIIQAFRKYGKN